MLAILQFDAASVSVLDGLLADGQLTNLARLRKRGEWKVLDAPATQFAAGAQHTLYSGVELADHGLFYPFQWSPQAQRVHYMDRFEAPPPVWERLGAFGARTLAIDPYESRAPSGPVPGTLVCGWQLQDRVVLRRWAEPKPVHRQLTRLFGKPAPVHEVFGMHGAREMLGLRERLIQAPARVADAADHLLQGGQFDLAWLTFCAAHVAGHQFWDLSQVDPEGLDERSTHLLATALTDIYVEIDRALGRIVERLPPHASILVVSPVGMDVNTSQADLLPQMLQAILVPGEKSESSIWSLRAAIPGGLRSLVARVLPERTALDLTARLELRGLDWNETRAFAHPAENQGYIRLNVRGRERDGIVPPEEVPGLMREIARGLSTFVDEDGAPAVKSVERVSDLFGGGTRAELLPDLIVRWSGRPAADTSWLTSDQFGTVTRRGVGSGRSGNHTEGDAWVLMIPGDDARVAAREDMPRLEDVAATAVAIAGGDTSDMSGTPLLVSTTRAG